MFAAPGPGLTVELIRGLFTHPLETLGAPVIVGIVAFLWVLIKETIKEKWGKK